MKPDKAARWLLAPMAISIYAPAACAYLDPVTGSMIIQGLIGAIAGAAVAIKLYWRQLKSWFGGVTGKALPGHRQKGERVSEDVAAAEKD